MTAEEFHKKGLNMLSSTFEFAEAYSKRENEAKDKQIAELKYLLPLAFKGGQVTQNAIHNADFLYKNFDEWAEGEELLNKH